MQKPDSGILQKLGVQKLDVFAFNLTQLGFNLLYLHASDIQEYSLYFHAVNPNKKQVEEWRLLTAAVFVQKQRLKKMNSVVSLISQLQSFQQPVTRLPAATNYSQMSSLHSDVLWCVQAFANVLEFGGTHKNSMKKQLWRG